VEPRTKGKVGLNLELVLGLELKLESRLGLGPELVLELEVKVERQASWSHHRDR